MSEKKSVSQLRKELKEMRLAHPEYQPVSKMVKADVSALISKLKNKLETTPAVAIFKEHKEVVEKKAPVVKKEAPIKKMKAPVEKKEAEVKDGAMIKEKKPVVDAKERMVKLRESKAKKSKPEEIKKVE